MQTGGTGGYFPERDVLRCSSLLAGAMGGSGMVIGVDILESRDDEMYWCCLWGKMTCFMNLLATTVCIARGCMQFAVADDR